MQKKQKLDESVKKLVDWATSNGARFSFDLATSGDRGAFCSHDIELNSEICFIPASILLSESVAMNSDISKTLMAWLDAHPAEKHQITGEQLPHALEIICMAIFMIDECSNPDSHWKPYLNALPETYSLPLNWDARQLSLLNGTPLEFTTAERLKWVDAAVEICSKACSVKGLTTKSFLWAFSSISSRAFPKSRQEQSEVSDWITITEICLYPLLDMLNHERNKKIEWRMDDLGVCFIAKEVTLAGMQVFNNYGPKGNENLLSNYGFVLKENPEDYYKIYLNIYPQDPLCAKKKSILAQRERNSLIHLLFADDDAFSPDLLAIVRVLVANTYELSAIEANGNFNSTSMLSLRNEFVAMQTLHQLISDKLSILRKGNPKDSCRLRDPEHFQMAHVYRSGQIQVLERAIANLCKFSNEILKVSADCPVYTAVNSVFFYRGHPRVSQGFLSKLESLASEHDLEDDAVLSILALHTANLVLTQFSSLEHHQILGEALVDYTEYYEQAISPMFDVNQDLFLRATYNLHSMINCTCVLDRFGADYDFQWLGLAVKGEGMFLDLKLM